MPLDIDNVFGIHAQALSARARRAEVLAANLANSDTPGYKARDLSFSGLLAVDGGALPPVMARATHAAHVQPAALAASGGELLYRSPNQPALDGNTVDTQVEQAEFARNALHYQASLGFLNGRIRSILTAIRGD